MHRLVNVSVGMQAFDQLSQNNFWRLSCTIFIVEVHVCQCSPGVDWPLNSSFNMFNHDRPCVVSSCKHTYCGTDNTDVKQLFPEPASDHHISLRSNSIGNSSRCSRMPGHHRIGELDDPPSSHILKVGVSRNHCPVLSCTLLWTSLCRLSCS
jgi:hypothetical protein